MLLQQIFDPRLAQYSYFLGCQETGEAIVIDPQRDIDRYLRLAEEKEMRIVAAADTHIHADYVTGLREFAELDGVTIYASGEGGDSWQYEWLIDSDYDHVLLSDGAELKIGNIAIKAQHTPGHTPEHLSYLVTDTARDPGTPICLISGDFVFVGDVGRPDLLESAVQQKGTMVASAEQLFKSVNRFRELPESLMLLPGHGAGSACGKALGAVPQSTVGYELATNASILVAREQSRFVDFILRDQPEPPAYFARMKSVNRDGPAILGRLPEPRQLSLEEFTKLVEAEEDTIIDTRNWEQFREQHVPRSLFIPLTSAVSTLIGSYVEPEARIYLIAEQSDLEEFTRQCVRVGVDKVEGYITPQQLESWIAQGGPTASIEETSIFELQQKANSDGVTAVDVRRSAELIELPGIARAYNISHTQLSLRFSELPADTPLDVYCRTGSRSRYATAFLRSKGIKARNVTGGALDLFMARTGR